MNYVNEEKNDYRYYLIVNFVACYYETVFQR